MQFTEKRILSTLFLVVLIISGTVRVLQTINYNFPLTYDQARDLIDIRVMANFYDFKISGPMTSIPGLNLGPFYYLFNLPAFWLGGGNPEALVIWNIIWFLASATAIYVYFYKKDVVLGFFISTIFLMAPQLFSVTRYFWNANSVVYFIVFYLLTFWEFIEKRTKTSALIWGITAALVIQFEAAFGSLCVAFSFLVILFSRKKVNVGYYLLGFLPWFIPQLGFEILHKFQMIKLLLGTFSASTSILGTSLPLSQIIVLHWQAITSFFEGQFMLPYGVGFALLILGILISLKISEYRKQLLYFLLFISFVFLYFCLIYRHELKPWYLDGVRVWYCFMVGMALANLVKFKKIIFLILALFLTASFYLTIIDQSSYISAAGKTADPKNAANLITSIDWIYERANGVGFDAYDYVPEVYDFSAQYLYWWHGGNVFGYTPQTISYNLAPVPQYIRNGDKFQVKARLNSSGKIALMYETQGNYQVWLDQFKNYCLLDQKTFSWHVKVEWRQQCQ